MRIYYFGTLIADTETPNTDTHEASVSSDKATPSGPRLIRDILVERPYGRRSLQIAHEYDDPKPKRSLLPPTFTIRHYAHA